MPTISYTPIGWNGSDSAANAPETVRLETAVQAAINTVQADLDAAEADIADLDYGIGAVTVKANDTAPIVSIVKPTARTISAIHVRANVVPASAGGTITLAVKDQGGTTLLSTATINAETLTTSFVAQTLTATSADLAMAAGEAVQLVVVADNADATGGPIIVRITYA